MMQIILSMKDFLSEHNNKDTIHTIDCGCILSNDENLAQNIKMKIN